MVLWMRFMRKMCHWILSLGELRKLCHWVLSNIFYFSSVMENHCVSAECLKSLKSLKFALIHPILHILTATQHLFRVAEYDNKKMNDLWSIAIWERR